MENLASRFLLTSDDIFFTGHIPFDELLAVYQLGDIFVSMSEHEGFCLPLIESCFFQIPVIAYNAGAVADTLDGYGILVNNKKYEDIAALIEKVLENKKNQQNSEKCGKKRIKKYSRHISSRRRPMKY